ncbi:thioesterase domain-containing protein [Streptomyces venezuelae]|uniref:thioesterase domain-containing protein n=1 Tax=Streptomyces venezuelae TaxID=54571 RepID=UPI003797188B
MTRDGGTPSLDARIESLSPARRELYLRLLRERANTRPPRADDAGDGVVVLREGAPGRTDPIVLVHPIGGGVFCYGPLARLLDGPRPVWAVAADTSPSADGGRTVAGLAEHYLELLAGRGVRRPGLLGGWSFGGLVAHEMARRHPAAQQRPVPVALVDSAPWPPGTGAWTTAETLRAYIDDLVGSGGADVDVESLPDTLWHLPVPDALDRAAHELAERGFDLGLGTNELRRRYTVFELMTRAMQDHTPGEYAGPVALLYATASGVGPQMWRPLSTGAPLVPQPLPGDHFSLLTGETVRDIARLLLHSVNDL